MSIQKINSNTLADGAVLNSIASSVNFRNRIINGDMRIDQRNAGASVTTSVLQGLTYTLDRWAYYNDVVSKRTIQQVSTAPAGFNNSLKVTVIATDVTGPQQFINHRIEGFNAADLGWGTADAQAATLSFWVRSSVTGQMGGSIQNSATNRSYPFAYTINTADTWEYKTVAITGDTSGTWLATNGIGLSLIFENGPGYQKAAAGAWTAQNSTSSTGSVNLCATNGATWYITGVQLEAGSVATPFERRPYGTELALCQRYFETITGGAQQESLTVGSHSVLYGKIPFQVMKRANPTITYANTTRNSVGFTPAGAVRGSQYYLGMLQNTGGAAFSSDIAVAYDWSASAEL
jgi:hypothetical protein